MAPTKGKSKTQLVFQTQIKEIKRYSENVGNVIESDNIQRVFALKCNILKCLERLEDNYYEFSVLEEFVEDVEYENFTNSKDLADLALEKIESYLTSINSKLQFEENKLKVNAYSNINLPKYDLPQFAGDFNSWLSFKSIFSSSIDSNESLTDIQKLQYLQNAVTSDASRLIKGFAITHENYKQAWETLLNRYDNQRELAFSQCKRFFSLRNVKPTSESIWAMIDVCNEVLRNFKTLGLECNQLVELLLVFSLQDKLEDSIKVKWELTLEDKNFPSLNKFLSFLEKQARSLQGNHNVSSCKFTTSCRACKQRHHTVLHQFQSSPREIPVSNSNQNLAATSDQNVVQPLATSQEQFCLAGQMNYSNSILLSTAIVRVKNSQGQYVNCRALIDGGSQTSLITESCSKYLNLPFYESENTILGLDNKVAAYATKRVELQLSPHFSQDIFAVNALVVKELTCNLPNFIVSKFDWPHINGLQLADPSFYISRPVDMILGADVFFDLILYGKISGTKNQPSALNSKLGWLLSGKVSTACQSQKKVMSLINCHALLDLQNQIAKFWEVESIPDASNLSEEDQRVEKFYLDHTRRNRDGRYVVSLPFKNDNALGDSKVQAKRRFFSLEKRLQANPELRDRYVKFMQDYEHLGHMQLVPNSELSKPSSKCFYLPHFGVVREQSETTKLRVVFDASAKTDSNLSLNDILHTGPKLQNELFNILLKFRCHRIALTGDIEKMFRQILVNEDDVEFQRIFWREIPEESTIQQLAEEEIKKFPEASKVALEDFYVDDLITGTNSKEDAKKLVSQVIELMKKGGFPIRKWASNESSVLESLPTQLRSSSGSLHIEEDHLMKILGIIWNSKEDTFRINISPPNEVRPTKRQLLSTIAKIYDPLGFLSPTTIQLKILMQDIWKENISWDDPVTDCIFESWTQFKNQMKHLAEIQIPRYLAEDATAKRVLLIGFCDASQRAYAAVFYLRTELVTGKVHVSMITSKTRVAPVKSITLPRLELLAALLLSELYVVVLESLRKVIQIDKSFLFSDSQIVLDWLKSSPSRWKIFVANRISRIQKMTSEASWHHVKSQENPADCASRGIAASKLKVHKLWWSGPQWLSQDSLHFPSIDLSTSCEEDVKCEEKSSTVLTNVSTSSQGSYLLEIIAKYSSFSRLIRVIAWCKRYIKNCRLSRVTGVLTSKEVDDATKIVIQTVQESQFHSEIQLLNKKHPLPNSSKLLPLSIFLDTDGIIKVGGRLKIRA
ncbi:integrase catalytic domain-containing protein [Trichonephila clavipes]|nr:integrase catalytic domain-containing protein [Trichonephila clavipes]